MKQKDPSSMSHEGDEHKSSKRIQYTCSMHPEVVSAEPGKCPKCGMTLVKKEEAKGGKEGHNMGGAMHSNIDEGMGAQYTCVMHPEVVSDKPGSCPKCGMALVLKKEMSNQNAMIINHYNTLYWTHATIMLLGFFLIAAPFTFGYESTAMTYSDIISGVLLIVFSLLSANPFRARAPWASA